MASAAEAPVGARTEPGRSIARNRVDVVDAGVLAPLPDVAAHVIDPELVRRLGGDVMRARAKVEAPPAEEPPSPSPAEEPHSEAARARPALAVPRDGVSVIAPAEGEPIGPMR